MRTNRFQDSYTILTVGASGIDREILHLLYSSTQNDQAIDFNPELLIWDWVKSNWQTVWSEKTGNWLTQVFPIATNTGFFEAAGKVIPRPFPQSIASTVAKNILSGVAKGKTKIFLSPLFYLKLRLNKILPVILPLNQPIEYHKYKNLLKKQLET